MQCAELFTIFYRLLPVSEFHLLPGAVNLAVGGYHTCGVLADRSVVCWGANDQGQLGTGDTSDRYTPTAVTGLGTGEQARGACSARVYTRACAI